MTRVADIVDHLTGLGVRLVVENGELVCRASRTIATPEVRNLVAANKLAILAYLTATDESPDDLAPLHDFVPNVPGKHPAPVGCIAWRHACPVLGPCDRHLAGHPCLVADVTREERAA